MTENITRNRCGFCGHPGHRINKCSDPRIKMIDDAILKSVALSSMFEFVGSTYIEYTLSHFSHSELKAIKYYFKISENAKKKIKTKKGIIEHLVTAYRNIALNIDAYELCVYPFVKSIKKGVVFNPQEPNRLPSREVYDFACEISDICRSKFPERPDFSAQIFSWYENKIAQFEREKSSWNFVNNPRKFNVIAVVSPFNDSDKDFECPICYQEEIKAVCSAKMNCGHSYCTGCMENYLESKVNEIGNRVVLRCGMCREEIEGIYFKDPEKALTIKNKYFR